MNLVFYNETNVAKGLTFQWSPLMEAMLKANCELTARQLAEAFGIGIHATRLKLYEMGLYKMQLEYWTREQITFLKKNYKKIGDKELAILFNLQWEKEKRWTWKHIEKKRLYLALKRTPAQLKKIRQRNKQRGCWTNLTTWKTRHASPDGTIKIWRGSWGTGSKHFKVIKVNGKYHHYAQWLYIKTYGPFKPGHIVSFKDGDNMNVVPGNLEQISRGEHSRRNRKQKYPDDIMQLTKLLDDLNNLIIKNSENGTD